MRGVNKKSVAVFSLVSLGIVTLVAFANCGKTSFEVKESPSVNSITGGPGAIGASQTNEKTCGQTNPGHSPIHRLTNREYNNSVRDLLYSKLKPADAFPADAPGESGFNNDSDSLKIYDELVSHYFEAAEKLVAEFNATKSLSGGAYSKIAPCGKSVTEATKLNCATTTIRDLGLKFFRRPLTEGANDSELNRMLAIFSKAGSFDAGLSDVIESMLMSPKFLFVVFTPPNSQDPNDDFVLDNYQLASRLSYFLWNTVPDERLYQLAKSGVLTNAETLQSEVQRMLRDPKSESFVQAFTNEWAGLQSLRDSSIAGLDDSVRLAMVRETQLFFSDILKNDRSFLAVLNGRYTFVNKALAEFYGIPAAGATESEFVRVDYPATDRIGVVTQASLLTVTAGDSKATHPVIRGKWVAAKILCAEPSPPPDNVPTITVEPTDGLSIRDKLEQHTSNPACIGCHRIMDTAGLALENYDPFGKWRDSYQGTSILVDATGELPGGKPFHNASEMFVDLAESRQSKSCLTRQVMNYSLSRELNSTFEKCVAIQIGEESLRNEVSLSEFFTKIVLSSPFRMQGGNSL